MVAGSCEQVTTQMLASNGAIPRMGLLRTAEEGDRMTEEILKKGKKKNWEYGCCGMQRVCGKLSRSR